MMYLCLGHVMCPCPSPKGEINSTENASGLSLLLIHNYAGSPRISIKIIEINILTVRNHGISSDVSKIFCIVYIFRENWL